MLSVGTLSTTKLELSFSLYSKTDISTHCFRHSFRKVTVCISITVAKLRQFFRLPNIFADFFSTIFVLAMLVIFSICCDFSNTDFSCYYIFSENLVFPGRGCTMVGGATGATGATGALAYMHPHPHRRTHDRLARRGVSKALRKRVVPQSLQYQSLSLNSRKDVIYQNDSKM